ncbi:MAG: VPLPA-CTERM sorting domain-containing protein [Hahellaceae bacterium]|nr:VPLPA-CTERM sorting domain-containing protein [Hahellaceae bacterium]
MDHDTYRAVNLTSLTLTPVAPVPLPAAAWMFLTALGGFAGLRLRKCSAIR